MPMKVTRISILAALLFAAGASGAAARGAVENGKVWRDTAGKEIWCNGGQMLREGNTFYWVGYDCGPRRKWRIRMYSSKDLVNWKFENNIFEKAPGIPDFVWAGRPGILHNRKTGKYVMLFEAETGKYFRHKVGYAVCEKVNGDYRWAHSEYPEPTRSTGDQSVYQEGDDAYLLTVLDSPGPKKPINVDLAIYKLTPDFLHVEKKLYEGFDRRWPWNRGNEATHIMRVDGTYYWFASGLNSWNSTETRYATAKSLSGPWSFMKVLKTAPRSGNSFNTQYDFVMPVAGTSGTIWLYAGDRYSQWTGMGTGRNIFLPLEFRNGVPRLDWLDSWVPDAAAGTYK